MEFFRVARIVNTFGIRGQMKILIDTDFIEDRFKIGNQLYILHDDQMVRKVIVESLQQHKGAYLIQFKDLYDINQVEQFKGMFLAISAEDQHELEEDAYYYHQIIGLKVLTLYGKNLGTIKEILTLGSNDVWVVKPSEHNHKDILLPFIDDVVKKVDLEKDQVWVELMEGLIDEG